MIYLLSKSKYADDLVTLGYARNRHEIGRLAIRAYRDLYPYELIRRVTVDIENSRVRVIEDDDYFSTHYVIHAIPSLTGV